MPYLRRRALGIYPFMLPSCTYCMTDHYFATGTRAELLDVVSRCLSPTGGYDGTPVCLSCAMPRIAAGIRAQMQREPEPAHGLAYVIVEIMGNIVGANIGYNVQLSKVMTAIHKPAMEHLRAVLIAGSDPLPSELGKVKKTELALQRTVAANLDDIRGLLGKVFDFAEKAFLPPPAQQFPTKS